MATTPNLQLPYPDRGTSSNSWLAALALKLDATLPGMGFTIPAATEAEMEEWERLEDPDAGAGEDPDAGGGEVR